MPLATRTLPLYKCRKLLPDHFSVTVSQLSILSLNVAKLALLLHRSGLAATLNRVFMTSYAARVKGVLGLWRFTIFLVLMTFVAGFYHSSIRFQRVVTGFAFSNTQTRMHLMLKSNNTQFGVKLNHSFVLRNC